MSRVHQAEVDAVIGMITSGILGKSLDDWRVDKYAGMIGVQSEIDSFAAAQETFTEDVSAQDFVYVWFGREVGYTTTKAAVGMKRATQAEADEYRDWVRRYVKGEAARDCDGINAGISKMRTALIARAA